MGAESVTALIPHYGSPRRRCRCSRPCLPSRRLPELQVVARRRRLTRAVPRSRRASSVVRRDDQRRLRCGRQHRRRGGRRRPAPGPQQRPARSARTFVRRPRRRARAPGSRPSSARASWGPTASSVPTGRRFPRVRHQVTEWLVPLARWRDTDALHRAVGHDVDARDAEAVVDWVVGGRDPGADRRLPRRGRVRRALLHELRGGRPPAPAPRAGPAVRRALPSRPRCTPAAARATPRDVASGWCSPGWRTPTSGAGGAGCRPPWVRPPPPTWSGTPAAAWPVATSRRCAPLGQELALLRRGGTRGRR